MAKTLGEKLRMVRGSLTQTELAQMLDIPQGYISRYEKGVVKPSIYFIYGLEKHFNVSLDWLLNDVGEMYKSPVKKKKEKFAPEVIEVVNILKSNKKLAKTIKKLISKKDSAKILKAISSVPEKRLRAVIDLLE